MKKLTTISILFALIIFGSVPPIMSQNLPDPMQPARLVNDFTSFLTQDEVLQLEGKLRKFNTRSSTQIYVVIVEDLDGYEKGDYATRLGEKWGIGQKGKNNGILILVKPKSNESKGEVFIAVGYGLEGVVPDAVANRIVDQEIIPAFKEGAYFKGLDDATNRLVSITEGEFTAEEYLAKSGGKAKTAGPIGFIIFMIILFSLFGGRSRMNRHSSVGRNLPFWLLMGMMGSGSRSSHGTFGDFSSGSGGFGGFGGFGGGGGGSFGGGGAGGSW